MAAVVKVTPFSVKLPALTVVVAKANACELTEAKSVRQRHTYRQRMLKAIARIQSRQGRGSFGDSDPSPVLLTELKDALCRELRPESDTYPRLNEGEKTY